MRVFYLGTGLLALSFLVHLIIWRAVVPRRQIRALLLIFTFVPAVALTAAATIGALPAFTTSVVSDALRLVLFYVSCSLVYIIVYSAVEMPSPTLTIVSLIASCRPGSCPEEEIVGVLADTDDLNMRIRAMTTASLIAFDGGRCRLTPKGRLIAALFEFASGVFGLPPGG